MDLESTDLENQIRNKLSKLDANLSMEQKSDYHFKSIHNFVHHIFKEGSDSISSGSQLKKINLKRNREMIQDYLDMILEGEVGKDDSTFLFKKYIKVIGEFMNRNYGFSFAGGKIKYFLFLIYATVGVVVDMIFWFLLNISTNYIFTLVFLVYSIVRTSIKYRKKKVYGPNF